MASPDAVGDPTEFYRRLVTLLGGGERVALCTLLRLTGSGPRGAGAKMLVRVNGQSVGTVGGGTLEALVTGWAGEVLQTARAICRSVSLNPAQAAEAGMVCGGEVEVLAEPLDGTESSEREFFATVLAHLEARRRGWLATVLQEGLDGVRTGRLLVAQGRPVAAVPLSGHVPPEEFLASPVPRSPSLLERDAVRYFVEPLAPPETVYVFGAGHLAEHLVPLCHRLGFRTVVVDDRADFATRERFPQADELVVPASFGAALVGLPIDKDSYLVIVTRGHAGDQAVLRQALQRRAAYIGMIGSRRKRDVVYTQLAGEGFSPADLARVACPIGLSIGAETPEEIAVSISAQLIATRSARRGQG